jgi:predicted patatin/cPLA2 family phospholipase
MNASTQRRRLLPVLACVLAAGCVHTERFRASVPEALLRSRQTVDLSAPCAFEPLDPEVSAALAGRFEGEPATPRVANHAAVRPLSVLALSGGGMNGAFTVGVLNGWTASGTRPTFDVVTGISTGALIAPFAFLGPDYDAVPRRYYTEVRSADVYQLRPGLSWLWGGEALASSEPLARLIDQTIDADLLREVAKAHSTGRRLYVGTTNLDARRLVIWDMGAIAARGTPESLELFRKVMLASCSVPGFFPPVYLDVEIDGKRSTEMHVDGGVSTVVFVRASMLGVDESALRDGARPLAGSDLYVITAGKLYADPQCVAPEFRTIAGSSIESLLHAQTRNDLFRVYCLSLVTGMRFRLAAVPQEFEMGKGSLEFDPALMRRLFEAGYAAGKDGTAWREPPVAEPAGQDVPRSGTRFATPPPAR